MLSGLRRLPRRALHAPIKPIWGRLRQRIEHIVDDRAGRLVDERIAPIEAEHLAINETLGNLRRTQFTPTLVPDSGRADADFLTTSNCQTRDFVHPRYFELAGRLGFRPELHRKPWEWVYVLHHLERAGVLRPGARGLGFGVGREPLPAYFASVGIDVTATDAPTAQPVWTSSGQFSSSVEELFYPDIVGNDVVAERVAVRPCDMRAIDPDLVGYDFNWSSCCFEHLGSLEAGLEFVVNAVERTLKPGGVGVHTTEFNLSSADATVTDGVTVLYRTKDIEELVLRLRERGHEVQPFVLGAPEHHLDYHVDVPPYTHHVHMKLWLEGYVATSVGIVVRRGNT